jgi:hypothetical protein
MLLTTNRPPGRLPLGFLFLNLLAFPACHSLRTAPGSVCSSLCTDSTASTSTTSSSEIVCQDSDYNSTSQGTSFQSCISCQLAHNHVDQATGESDLAWAIYNIRFAFDTCVYGFPDSDASASNPCVVSCTPIQKQLEVDVKEPTPSVPFDYCTAGTFMAGVGQCTYCYSLLANQKYLASFLNVLQLGCEEQPAIGVSLTNTPEPFSENPAATSIGNIVIATSVPSSTSSSSSGSGSGLSTGAKVGIGLGALLGFVILVACITISISRRRKKLKVQQHMNPWAGSQPAIPPPHSPAWPPPQSATRSAFSPYSDTSPVNKDESPITPLERIFYPKGVTSVREHEMEMVDQMPKGTGGYVWPEQQRKLRLQTEGWQRGRGGRKEEYSAFPSSEEGEKVSPQSFT